MFKHEPRPHAPAPAPDLSIPIATDATYGTRAALVREGGEYSLRFDIPDQTPLIISLSPERFFKLRAAITTDPAEKKSEIEGKWLVRDWEKVNSWMPQCRVKNIEQGYAIISAEGTEIRVRKTIDDGYTKHELTIKGKGEVIRGEGEVAIPEEDFRKITGALVKDRSVVKDRYVTPYRHPFLGDVVLEVDHYRQAGPQTAGGDEECLPPVTVEVEFGREEDYRTFAETTGKEIGLDITKHQGFKNQSLAVRGFPAETAPA